MARSTPFLSGLVAVSLFGSMHLHAVEARSGRLDEYLWLDRVFRQVPIISHPILASVQRVIPGMGLPRPLELDEDGYDVAPRQPPEHPRVAAPSPKERSPLSLPRLGFKGEVEDTVRHWAEAWSRRDLDAFQDFYATGFRPLGERSLRDWSQQHARNFKVTRFIRVTIQDLSVHFFATDLVTVSFLQRYRSDLYADKVEKTLFMSHETGYWKILAESSSLPPQKSAEGIPPQWCVQVGAFKEKQQAEALVVNISHGMSGPFIQEVTDNQGKRWFSVRFGRFKKKSLAKIFKWAFIRQEGRNAFVASLGSP